MRNIYSGSVRPPLTNYRDRNPSGTHPSHTPIAPLPLTSLATYTHIIQVGSSCRTIQVAVRALPHQPSMNPRRMSPSIAATVMSRFGNSRGHSNRGPCIFNPSEEEVLQYSRGSAQVLRWAWRHTRAGDYTIYAALRCLASTCRHWAVAHHVSKWYLTNTQPKKRLTTLRHRW